MSGIPAPTLAQRVAQAAVVLSFDAYPAGTIGAVERQRDIADRKRVGMALAAVWAGQTD